MWPRTSSTGGIFSKGMLMEPISKILVVDDDEDILTFMEDMLSRNPKYQVTTFSDSKQAVKCLTTDAFDLVITDLNMPDVGGMEILEYVENYTPDTLCIILTGYGSIANAVIAVKKGAFDYVTKPVSPADFMKHVEDALKVKWLKKQDNDENPGHVPGSVYENFIGTSSAIKKIHRLIEKVADTDTTVLVTGASGTGKELIVRTIHRLSNRREHPFVAVNCGAIPEALLESEIFGHEKGAFTGAHKKRLGRFEMAREGTIFLDEVAEMSPALQVKLLRVLQEKVIERVGGTCSIEVNARVIAATNKELATAVKDGSFREDLFYRLNVIPIHVPDLIHRKSDIPLLIDFFLDKFQRGRKREIHGFSSQAMDALISHDWPGNVRELENMIKRMIILCENSMVTMEDLPEYFQKEPSLNPVFSEQPLLNKGMTLADAVKEYENRLILSALEESDGVKAQAARILNIKRTTLVEKIKKNKILDTES